MGKINSAQLEFGASVTDLCKIGMITQADKSPFNTGKWKHSYTPLYDMLLSHLRYRDDVNFGEVGTYKGGSLEMWSRYFTKANIYGWDHSHEFIEYIKALNIDRVTLDLMDQSDEQNLRDCLDKTGVKFDVLLDDGSHLFWDQIKFIRNATSYLKPGGILIIEDIEEDVPEDQYRDAIYEYNHMCYYSHISFVTVNHENKFLDPFKNDKVLIMIRNSVE
jgi:SAM-dependent methyltransferase